MNKCDNEYKIFEYIEGELSLEEKEKIENHIKNCNSCLESFESYSKINDGVSKYYKNVELSKSVVSTRINIKRRSKKLLLTAAVVFVTVLFILLIPIKEQNDLSHYPENADVSLKAKSNSIGEAKWHLEVNLLQQKIESIKFELEQKDKN